VLLAAETGSGGILGNRSVGNFTWGINLCIISNSTLAILSRQGGEMSFTLDELSQRSCYRRRTSHDATPARRDHTDLGPVCATLFGARLAACADVAPGGGANARVSHGDRSLAGEGACPGAQHVWAHIRFSMSQQEVDMRQIPRVLFQRFVDVLCYAAKLDKVELRQR
jgi:hypothetical protein